MGNPFEATGHLYRRGHYLLDTASAERCCNGYRRELRLGGALPDDDFAGSTAIPGTRHVWVWVPTDGDAA